MKLEKLKMLRERTGYSHAIMAEKLGISKVYYWQLEQGGRRLYYFLALKIAAIFDLKPDEIFYQDFK